jgi:hypothetical protein
MSARILFSILAAGIGVLMAAVPLAPIHRIGPAEIYPDPVRTPGASNPQITQRNSGDTPCLLLDCWVCVSDNGFRVRE